MTDVAGKSCFYNKISIEICWESMSTNSTVIEIYVDDKEIAKFYRHSTCCCLILVLQHIPIHIPLHKPKKTWYKLISK